MKSKLFNNLLLFSLFGIALYSFGILYEGVIYGPKLLDVSMERMHFWKDFTSIISPVIYYVPWVYLATIVLVVLYFKASKEKPELKKRLRFASIFQIASLMLTIYILVQINFKMSFSNLEKYAGEIPGKVFLFNILSITRVALAAMGLTFIFKAYIQTQQAQEAT